MYVSPQQENYTHGKGDYLWGIYGSWPVWCSNVSDDDLVAMGQALVQRYPDPCKYYAGLPKANGDAARDVDLQKVMSETEYHDIEGKAADAFKDVLVGTKVDQVDTRIVDRMRVVEDIANNAWRDFCP
jgi:hypothetical protein